MNIEFLDLSKVHSFANIMGFFPFHFWGLVHARQALHVPLPHTHTFIFF
jgi:hypothetical protein